MQDTSPGPQGVHIRRAPLALYTNCSTRFRIACLLTSALNCCHSVTLAANSPDLAPLRLGPSPRLPPKMRGLEFALELMGVSIFRSFAAITAFFPRFFPATIVDSLVICNHVTVDGHWENP